MPKIALPELPMQQQKSVLHVWAVSEQHVHALAWVDCMARPSQLAQLASNALLCHEFAVASCLAALVR